MTDLQKEPKVSIVCAWYNRADYIRDTVDSLLNQDFDDYEIIIANDGSPDPRVKEILDSYDDPKLTVIHKDNEGFTKTIKMLVECEASTPFVAIQGAGDTSYPNRLKKQYEYLINHAEIGAVGSGFNVESENSNGSKYSAPTEVKTVNSLKKRVPFTHGTIMYRKTVYLNAGGYDTRFKYCSDWDLYFRILEVSKISAIDEALYKKIEFNDGFSFSPLHKFSQALYAETAINRSSEREEIVGTLQKKSENIKPYQPYYLYRSARYVGVFLKKGDYTKAYLWFKYFIVSIVQAYKGLIR